MDGWSGVKAGMNPNSPGYVDDISNSSSSNNFTLPQASYGETPSGLRYDPNNADSYINAWNQEAAWLREDLLRQKDFEREDTAYDRLFEQLKRNGINPALLLSNASPLVGNSYNNAASFKTSSYDTNARTAQANNAKVFDAIVGALAVMAAAYLGSKK